MEHVGEVDHPASWRRELCGVFAERILPINRTPTSAALDLGLELEYISLPYAMHIRSASKIQHNMQVSLSLSLAPMIEFDFTEWQASHHAKTDILLPAQLFLLHHLQRLSIFARALASRASCFSFKRFSLASSNFFRSASNFLAS